MSEALGLARSMILCGEQMSPQAEAVFDRARAALVESEAREREHEQRAELLRQTKARLADESTEAEAREAVLVEALREAETALDEINVQAHSTASRWIRNRSFDALAKLRSALAGVVEAERKDADA